MFSLKMSPAIATLMWKCKSQTLTTLPKEFDIIRDSLTSTNSNAGNTTAILANPSSSSFARLTTLNKDATFILSANVAIKIRSSRLMTERQRSFLAPRAIATMFPMKSKLFLIMLNPALFLGSLLRNWTPQSSLSRRMRK